MTYRVRYDWKDGIGVSKETFTSPIHGKFKILIDKKYCRFEFVSLETLKPFCQGSEIYMSDLSVLIKRQLKYQGIKIGWEKRNK